MKIVSILNHVLGPVMRGPSSSHTAGAWHIGCMARSILGGTPQRATLAFDPAGSYAATYAEQGAERGFAMGLMGRALTDSSFFTALQDATAAGMQLEFQIRSLAGDNHPNTTELNLIAEDGTNLKLLTRSIGGGEIEVTRIDGRPVLFKGNAYESLVEMRPEQADQVAELLAADGALLDPPVRSKHQGAVILTARRKAALPESFEAELLAFDAQARLWQCTPVYFVHQGAPLFSSAAEMQACAEQHGRSLGRMALAYEAQLLGMSEAEVMAEMLRRYDIMESAVESGLDPKFTGLQLLPPCAGSVLQAEAEGRLSVRSLHTRAAARAMAVMHVDGAMGVVCAAPTGGAAGVIPGALLTLVEERGLTREQSALALLAAGGVGMILAIRGTFAAEVAGCQVEIGAAGAMAAAAVVDGVGGSAAQACNAAAIAFQNTMGLVCDLLHGIVEIPCHTRNAVAAANAFVNADLILGGYVNLIPLDETIDAVYAVGLTMPAELRCTSKGGLAICPSAKRLKF
ncbi:MAG: L-serine ammonia-lyase, iron-sulfur-dependent, subunit alpha [Kiritimatiellae bacterium]|nr:L-serine ammonia-lyase, iron-sulfur-dependent, subunit alpha [Kiritimatiellia bacterium]